MEDRASKNLLIRDLIEAPEIKTVIQLDDLKENKLRSMIVDTFVLTDEIHNNLKSALNSFSSAKGRGIFLKGHFGSGKSHFLSMLTLLLRHSGAWNQIISQDHSFETFQKKIINRQFLAAEISLVSHRGSEFLEDIVVGQIMAALGEEAFDPSDRHGARHEVFSDIAALMRTKGHSGLVILVDELSEFLRSKSDGRAYNEDIRFLQYLGEAAGTFPLWVIASLQEWIEETGEIQQETFNKIKDRYPIRLNLGQAHIEELVSERLIRPKPGAEESIKAIFDELRQYFPTFPVSPERFIRLYPVHPATCTLLDRLKPIFSEHRGVVDFIHYRLKGDPQRQIPPLLDKAADQLLTPEVIFDHFLERIRERPETQVFVERVFESARVEIPELFHDPEQRELALATVKILILFAISPVKYRYTVRHVAEMALFRVTTLKTEINYRFLLDTLTIFAEQGSYVRVENRDDPLDNHYFIDLKADMAAIMRRRIKHSASELFEDDLRLFTKLGYLVDSPHLPISGWLEKGMQRVALTWQHTRRNGIVLLRRLDELTMNDIEALAADCKNSEDDFHIIAGTTHKPDKQSEHVRENLLPIIRERFPGMFLFWMPTAFEDDLARMKEVLAAILIKETLKNEVREASKQALDFIEAFIEKARPAITEHFTKSYYNGILLWDENRVELSRIGYLSEEKFLTEFIPPILKRRFPGHSRIQPFMDLLAPGIMREMLRDFFLSGIFPTDDRTRPGLRNMIEGILKPLGLVRKKDRQYLLHVHPKQNELAARFLDLMGDEENTPLEWIYWKLRKGDYGLLRPHFEILVTALLFSGNLVAYRGRNRKGPDELARTGLKGVTALGRGEILADKYRQAFDANPLIPKRFKNTPFTLASQEELWAELKAAKPSETEDLESLKSRMNWAAAFEAFREMPWQDAQKDVLTILGLWSEVKVSLASRAGLKRFIKAGLEEPDLSQKVATAREVKEFLKHAEHALFVYQYITDRRLRLPDGDEYDLSRKSHLEIVDFFKKRRARFAPESIIDLFDRFKDFIDDYTRIYVQAHQKSREGPQFEPYERLLRSRRYLLLKRLDRLEMISVEHDRRSIEKGISSVLIHRCLKSPLDLLQRTPVCVCGFVMGEQVSFKPLRELQKEIDFGIRESLEALHSPAMQEKIVPYLESLDHVEKSGEANAVRALLALTPEKTGFLNQADEILTPGVIRSVNDAFRGKVVVVKRDVDALYRSLVHRKYTLAQTREIIERWLESRSLTEDVFLHFLGINQGNETIPASDGFKNFLKGFDSNLAPLLKEAGDESLQAALLTALWIRQYDLSHNKVVEIFPFLDQGQNEKNAALISRLADLAGELSLQEPEIFETVVSHASEDAALIRILWSSLTTFSPSLIFVTESIFPGLLKEAFERIICAKPELPPPFAGHSGANNGAFKACSTLREQKNDMLKVIEIIQTFHESQTALSSPDNSGMEAFSRWEDIFVRSVSALPTLMDDINESLRRVGSPRSAYLKEQQKKARGDLNRFSSGFRKFYQTRLPVWESNQVPRPFMIRDIPVILKKKRNVPEHKDSCFILMDGMRWDLWEHIKTNFFEQQPDLFRIVRQGVMWTNQPTDTGQQLERLYRAAEENAPDLGFKNRLWKMSGLDEKIHTEKGPLTHLFSNVISFLNIELLYRLKKMPSRTLLILFADHGFVENPAFDPHDKYETQRYIHGKDSPFEALVPWAWVMRL